MQVPTHVLSGWCIANCVRSLNARERFFAMLAASLPDLDGISYVFGETAFQYYHHMLSHNLPFAILLALILAIGSASSFEKWVTVFLLYFALVHLHFLMDYIGSGPFWPIYYLWPIDRHFRFMYKTGWALFSWQNMTVFAGLFVWAIFIAIRQRRTPIELLAPRIDAMWVRWLRRDTLRPE